MVNHSMTLKWLQEHLQLCTFATSDFAITLRGWIHICVLYIDLARNLAEAKLTRGTPSLAEISLRVVNITMAYCYIISYFFFVFLMHMHLSLKVAILARRDYVSGELMLAPSMCVGVCRRSRLCLRRRPHPL